MTTMHFRISGLNVTSAAISLSIYETVCVAVAWCMAVIGAARVVDFSVYLQDAVTWRCACHHQWIMSHTQIYHVREPRLKNCTSGTYGRLSDIKHVSLWAPISKWRLSTELSYCPMRSHFNGCTSINLSMAPLKEMRKVSHWMSLYLVKARKGAMWETKSKYVDSEKVKSLSSHSISPVTRLCSPLKWPCEYFILERKTDNFSSGLSTTTQEDCQSPALCETKSFKKINK